MGLVIEHRDVNCASCEDHDRCRALESRFAPELAANGGNWRAIFYPGGGRVGTPTRRCTAAMIARHAHRFDGREVLEIGCGPLSGITEDFCRERNVRYTGIDPGRLPVFEIPWLPARGLQRRWFARLVRFGVHAGSPHRRFILDRFPSPKLAGRQFDVIYGASTIEHWHEEVADRDRTLAAYQADVRECWRLLRPGGVLLMNAPMFVHGNEWFVRGDVALVEGFFGQEWSSVTFEHWRERHDDLAPYRPAHRAAAFRTRFGAELANIWILNVVATK